MLRKAETDMADPKPEVELSPREVAEAKRAARKAALKPEYDAQRAIDISAVDELEILHGDSNVKLINIPHTSGRPTCVACRVPTHNLMKRYRSRVKPGKDARNREKEIDYAGAAEELGASCVIYPEKSVFDAICDERPGLLTQVGMHCLDLGTGHEEAEGKG